jgi:hypothetical protein
MSPRQVLRALGFAGLGIFRSFSARLPRGSLEGGGAPALIERVAQELEITPEEARTRARAVLETIREAVTPGELHDILVQLPSGFFEHIVA